MKKLILFGLVSALILIGSIGVSIYSHVTATRYFSRDVIFIAPLLNESHLLWNINDVEFLRHNFREYSFSAESRGNALITTSTSQVSATVVYTDAAYFQIHFMDFIEGNRWLEDANAIVLNEALAWRLFGGGNIVGLPVEINQAPYIVAGVVRQDQRGRGEYLAWMPRDTSPALLPVTALYVRAQNYNLVDIEAHTRGMQGMLMSQFRNPRGYAIVDINRYVESIGLRGRILMYILWAYILLLLLHACLRKRRQFKARVILSYIPPFLGILLSAYILFTGIGEILYWLPNLALPHSSVVNALTNLGALPPDGYLSFGLQRLTELNAMANIAWIVGAVAFVNIIICVSVMKGDAK